MDVHYTCNICIYVVCGRVGICGAASTLETTAPPPPLLVTVIPIPPASMLLHIACYSLLVG